MSLFTTRVELHKNATSEDYKTLHTEMEKEGFSRTIRLDSESVIYHLPTAEYNKSSDTLSTEQILELAKKAAARTNKTFSVLVTKADGRRYWHNLEPVK
ncbi:DUF2622 domain-containing protein [Mucilaginibacter sp. SG564]|uniref:DUF2622 domain-containing protein n=1 Tax=Mucilaginibacter sp. SG564 TaxID=2587022 RepID=UPI0015523C3A|nr:DUF2622 domain-containing protein [Mucilaginibacter sp. SG564]NOW94010.1 glucosamine 6-phosphate synthetase-like amidotransferase/phosphosugar isomerase protein [Mucilaginibacter sp. SG564]